MNRAERRAMQKRNAPAMRAFTHEDYEREAKRVIDAASGLIVVNLEAAGAFSLEDRAKHVLVVLDSKAAVLIARMNQIGLIDQDTLKKPTDVMVKMLPRESMRLCFDDETSPAKALDEGEPCGHIQMLLAAPAFLLINCSQCGFGIKNPAVPS